MLGRFLAFPYSSSSAADAAAEASAATTTAATTALPWRRRRATTTDRFDLSNLEDALPTPPSASFIAAPRKDAGMIELMEATGAYRIAPDTTHSEEDGQTHCSLLFRPTRAYEAFERGASVGPQAKGPESTGQDGGAT